MKGYVAGKGNRWYAEALVPAGRLGRPSDVARAVAFLCEPEAEHLTGQVSAAHGGLGA